MIEAVRASARHAGIPQERVRSERFLAAPMASTDQPVDLLLQRSGKRVRVAPDQTVLEAVEAAGVAAPAGCRIKMLGGTPLHRDGALTDDERTKANLMCICVSRAESAGLTLDL